MTLATGTKLGPYEIQSLAGAGGMGEVYRARDTRLDRVVAVKVLQTQLSSDSTLRQRFDREARAISSLSHPNICQLYDLGHQDGIDYFVMEFLNGETLANRLRKGPLPLDQLLKIGVELADALDKAHRLGIVHRDLKPGNIMLTKNGAKLMDFGLARPAKALAPLAVDGIALTLSEPLTVEGQLLGTLQYMSPEQLEGKEADCRTDIFALGEVIYEMATAEAAFNGKSQASLIAAILTSEPPPLTQLQPVIPEALERTTRKCLAKDPDERWQNAGDLAVQLSWIGDSGPQPAMAIAKRRNNLAWKAISFLLLATLALLTVAHFRRVSASPNVVRFSFAPPDKTWVSTAMAFSPDGSTLAFVGTSLEGKDQIWLRRLNGSAPEPLKGTDGASFPFWSPDSRYIGFFADQKLKIMPASGGPPRVLCDVLDGRGGAWGSQDVILFAPHWQSGLYRISTSGGEVRPATTLGEDQSGHRFPTFLPDGKHFVYHARGTALAHTGLYLGTLGGKQDTRLADGESFAGYADPGFLVFIQGQRLVAQAFDPNSLRLSGDALPLAESILCAVDFPQSCTFAVSQSGSLAFRTAPVKGNELVWFDRKGKRQQTLAQPGYYSEPALSHDGRYVAVQRDDDLVLIRVATGASAKLTSDGYSPTWSPDDKRIAFSLRQRGSSDIFVQEVGDSGSPKQLFHSLATKNMMDWSLDGRYIVWDNTDTKSQNRSDIYVMPPDERQQPVAFLSTQFEESGARFSPDGEWVVYTSDESGQSEVYVRPFPNGSDKLPVSIGGGSEPFWRGDGKEIFYLAPDRKIMSVALRASGTKLEAQAPVVLFRALVQSLLDARSHFVPTADGQRFLVVADPAENQSAPINIVLNFPADLTRR
ncbi:MAG: protein kinase [Candidatus Sulfotelmatobacter sp.]